MQTMNLFAKHEPLSLRTAKGLEFINPAGILYFSIEKHEVILYLLDGDTRITLHTLKELEALFELYNFYCCHARYLINMVHVKRYTHKTCTVELSNSQQLKVAFDRKTKFKQQICKALPPPVRQMARIKTPGAKIGFNLKNIGFRRYFVGFSAKNVGFSGFGVCGY